MLSASQFGSRLLAARKQRGLSREVVADELDLSGADVASLESGLREASVSEITRLGKIYQCSPLLFFLADGELGKDDLPAVVHRELSELGLTLEIKIALWRLFRLCGHGGVLRKKLNQRNELELPDYGAQRANASDSVLQGENAARKERLRLGLQEKTIRDVTGLIGRHGIWTAATGLPEGLSGLLVNHPDVGRVILVNWEYPDWRRNFFYLRAFAHALFDRSGRTVVTMRQKGLSDRGEIRSHAFATEFLMPREDVEKQFARIRAESRNSGVRRRINSADNERIEENMNWRSIFQSGICSSTVDLALHFCVSYEMAIERLESLDLISSKQKEMLVDAQKRVEEIKKRIEDDQKFTKDPQRLYKETQKPFKKNHPTREFVQLFCSKLKYHARTKTSEREMCRQLMDLTAKAFNAKKISRGRLIKIGRELKIKDCELCEYVENEPLG